MSRSYLSLRIRPETKEALRDFADQKDWTASHAAEVIIESFVKNLQKKKDPPQSQSLSVMVE